MSEISFHDRLVSSTGTGHWATSAALTAMALGIGVWALWPLGPTHAAADTEASKIVASGAASSALRVFDLSKPLDLAAFRTPLWVSPPPPPIPPQPPPPPPPLKLQLIAIVEGDAGHGAISPTPRSALIYDPDQDKLLSLTEGQSVQGRTVERISATGVDIKDQNGTRSLSLKSDPPREGAAVMAADSTKAATAPLLKASPPAQSPAPAAPVATTGNSEKNEAPAPEKKDSTPDPTFAPAPSPLPNSGGTR